MIWLCSSTREIISFRANSAGNVLGRYFKTSSHIQQQSTRPVLPSVWDAIKAVGLLRKTRGKRAGRYFNNCYRIKSILPTYGDDRTQSNSVIKFAGANRRLVDNTMIGNNNITIRRQPLLPPPIAPLNLCFLLS